MMGKQKIINIAVIAHVDAGKSTLVDAFLNQSGVFKPNEEVGELIMDSNDLERERGITIYSKNCAVFYKDYKINIVDTPGHADFSSEVERIIQTVDTVILLVDSSEGPMPQTRFVLQKSLELGLRPIVLINKIDKKDARIDEVIDLVYELFFDLNANDEQINFPVLYGIAKEGIVKRNLDDPDEGIKPLFETILNYAQPFGDLDDEPLQMQISNLAYDEYIGRLGIGRVFRGTLRTGEQVVLSKNDGKQQKCTITKLFVYDGIKRKPVTEARSGDIAIIAGIPDISIGETICEVEHVDPLPPIHIDEPTLSMNFMVNTSPFAGRVGKYVTSRNLKERLERELEVNVGLRVEPTDTTDTFKVSGRGELGLTILIENMRREGYELAISKPQVIYKTINGKRYEPVERVICEVPQQYEGSVISRLNQRNGEMVNITQRNNYSNVEFLVSTRGLIGFRTEFINMTRGEGILIRQFEDYMPYMGEINTRGNGVMVSNANGTAMTYSIWNLQERGMFFIGPQTEVYEGMIVGVCSKDMDMDVNPTKNKKATAVRSEGRDEAMKLVPPIQLTLEYALEFIDDDELVEVTPDAIRLRKRYLTALDRKNAFREKKKLEENA
ncbi:MAG: translational GTPase TypA [Erysipelotrichaceae bacterium]|nr:translational GTPase TypA [Erysipelotrichaceae bacterium]